MSMRWEKPSGQIMVTQDNEITEKKMLSLGMKKLGKEEIVLEDPEPETVEISVDDIPDDLPMSDPRQGSYDPYNPADPDEVPGPTPEEMPDKPEAA